IGSLIAIGAESKFLFLRGTKVLRLHRAPEWQVAAVDDELLVRELRLAIFEDNVRFLHPRTARGHFIGILRRHMRPGDVHALARDRRAFAALAAERRGGFRAALVEPVEKTLHPRLAAPFWVICLGPGQDDVAVGEVESA